MEKLFLTTILGILFTTGLVAQSEFFYSGKGEKEFFKVRKVEH